MRENLNRQSFFWPDGSKVTKPHFPRVRVSPFFEFFPTEKAPTLCLPFFGTVIRFYRIQKKACVTHIFLNHFFGVFCPSEELSARRERQK
jgi:hypothetical protein